MELILAFTGALSFLQTVLTFIIVIGVLIFFHEMGHFIAAKRSDILVEEFALGFGPALISRKRGETRYSLRAFPLGGFCKMAGEMPEEKGEESEKYLQAQKEGRCFFQKPAWKRFVVVAMGPIMNFVLAALLFSLVFVFYGLPVAPAETTDIGEVIPGAPAAEAGLRAGDRIIEVEGQPVTEWDEMAGIIRQYPEQDLEIKVQRRDEVFSVVLQPEIQEDGRGAIGIYPDVVREPLSFLNSLWMGTIQTFEVIGALFLALRDMITGAAPAEVGGPVRIAQMVGEAAEVGMSYLLNFMGFISINLGIINLLPIPALDGGRLIFIIVEMVRRKSLDPEKEGLVHFIGFVFLLILIGIIIIRDLTQVF